jgi:hypothetical protein
MSTQPFGPIAVIRTRGAAEGRQVPQWFTGNSDEQDE